MNRLFAAALTATTLGINAGCALLFGPGNKCAWAKTECETFVVALCDKVDECGGSFDECVVQMAEDGFDCAVAADIEGYADTCADALADATCESAFEDEHYAPGAVCGVFVTEDEETCGGSRAADRGRDDGDENDDSSNGDDDFDATEDDGRCTGTRQCFYEYTAGSCEVIDGCNWDLIDGECEGIAMQCDFYNSLATCPSDCQWSFGT